MDSQVRAVIRALQDGTQDFESFFRCFSDIDLKAIVVYVQKEQRKRVEENRVHDHPPKPLCGSCGTTRRRGNVSAMVKHERNCEKQYAWALENSHNPSLRIRCAAIGWLQYVVRGYVSWDVVL